MKQKKRKHIQNRQLFSFFLFVVRFFPRVSSENYSGEINLKLWSRVNTFLNKQPTKNIRQNFVLKTFFLLSSISLIFVNWYRESAPREVIECYTFFAFLLFFVEQINSINSYDVIWLLSISTTYAHSFPLWHTHTHIHLFDLLGALTLPRFYFQLI